MHKVLYFQQICNKLALEACNGTYAGGVAGVCCCVVNHRTSLGPRCSGGGANGRGGADGREEESAWYPLHARIAVEFHHHRVILGHDRARN